MIEQHASELSGVTDGILIFPLIGIIIVVDNLQIDVGICQQVFPLNLGYLFTHELYKQVKFRSHHGSLHYVQ
jgi:hypothetical protein